VYHIKPSSSSHSKTCVRKDTGSTASYFPGKSGLTSCSPNIFLHIFAPVHPLEVDQNLSHPPSHQPALPSSDVSSISLLLPHITGQHLIQSESSLRSTHPNHCQFPFLIIRLTGSKPNSCLSSTIFPSYRTRHDQRWQTSPPMPTPGANDHQTCYAGRTIWWMLTRLSRCGWFNRCARCVAAIWPVYLFCI